ncbi:MAG TPA: TetR/AcrR family transcriptional regulator [Solirubrobacteraceae bacterium]|nr:TetR/AcrR family transcriptional regulator [Solirubrobacteraceae bacterium]
MTPTPPRPHGGGRAAGGRARDPRLDEAIAVATRALVVELGFGGLTIEAIAHRAGVSRATVYRRWPNLDALLAHVLRVVVREIPIPDRGHVRDDLIEILGDQLRFIQREAGKLYPSLAVQAKADPDARRALSELIQYRQVAVSAVLKRGIERREIRDDVDLELAFFLVWGPVYYRHLFAFACEAPIDREFIPRLVDNVLLAIGT